MESPSGPIEDLRDFLQSLPETKSISDQVVWERLLPPLREAWDSLKGLPNRNKFKSILHRAKNVMWTSPLLTFDLQRLAPTRLRSSTAAVYHWQVNVETSVAELLAKKSACCPPC